MKKLVLDAYALIAYFEEEAGSDKVENILQEAKDKKCELLLSIINWGEIYYSIYRTKGEVKAEESILIIEQLPIKIVDISRTQVYEAAKLKAKYPVSYADCFCAQLAKENDCPILTADPDFKKLQKEVKIIWL